MKEDRAAIVVGGAGGLGSDISRRLASEGYQVTVMDINLAGAQEVVRSLAGKDHQAVKMDVMKEADVNAAFDAAEAHRPAAVLVLVAGGPVGGFEKPPHIATSDPAAWEKNLAFNITSVYLCMRKFAQQRLARPLDHARIVTISSSVGEVSAGPMHAGYVASKAAVFGLTRQVAFDLAPAHVTVNAIAPGPIGTPEFLRQTPPEFREQAASSVLLRRLGEPGEIGAGVVFLASRDASYITGTILDMNGGVHMH